MQNVFYKMIELYYFTISVILIMKTTCPFYIQLNAFSILGVMYAVATNYAYYLKEVKGEQGWNLFKGIKL